MLISSSQANAVVSTSQRARPVVTSGPVRTVRTDTGQIIRAGESIHISTTATSLAFQNSTWAANRALGLNTMRAGVISAAASLPLGTLLSNIDIVVDRARVNRMYLMLGYFAASPGTWGDNVAVNRTKWSDFWAAAAPRWKDEPHVFYEMVNEPTSWGQVSTFTPEIKAGLKDVYDVMRAGAPQTLIVFPTAANLGPSATQYASLMASLDSLGNGRPIDWRKTALGHHYYNVTHKLAVTGGSANATDGGRAGLLSLSATYPLICTETNWWMEPARDVLINALDLYEDIGIGWTLLRRAGQTTPFTAGQALGPLFLENKLAQLRRRGFTIPVE